MSIHPSRHYSDRGFEWRPGYIYIPAVNFSGLDYETTTATDLKSVDGQAANTTSVGEVSTFGITGVTMTTGTDRLNHLMKLPYDLDPSKNIYVSCDWCANTTSTSEAVTWLVTYKTLQANVTALSAATTALDKVIGSDTHPVATAFTYAESPEGVIKAGTISRATDGIIWRVEMNTETLTGSVIFLGLNIRYSPRKLRGQDGMAAEAKRSTARAGSQYF